MKSLALDTISCLVELAFSYLAVVVVFFELFKRGTGTISMFFIHRPLMVSVENLRLHRAYVKYKDSWVLLLELISFELSTVLVQSSNFHYQLNLISLIMFLI